MNALRIALVSLALSAPLAACSKHPAVVEIEVLADKICACPDAKCVEGLNAELTAYKAKFTDAKGSENDAKAVIAAQKKLTDCVKKLAK